MTRELELAESCTGLSMTCGRIINQTIKNIKSLKVHRAKKKELHFQRRRFDWWVWMRGGDDEKSVQAEEPCPV